MKRAIKIDPVKIDITNGTDLVYEFERTTVVSVVGKHGKAFMTVASGTWFFREMKKELGWLGALLVRLRMRKHSYFIRATRVS